MGDRPDIIDLALAEDIGSGDLTTQYFTPRDRVARASIVAKEPCVLSGLSAAEEVFRRVDPALVFEPLAGEGTSMEKGCPVLRLTGRAASILTAERVALNFLQRLSGIATLTRHYVDAVAGTSAKILDTRKTTPGWRRLEKAAVAAGGGTNHRMGLYDMVMVKDNHLVADSSLVDLQVAIRRVKTERPGVRVELEADTLEQVRTFLALEGVDVILLDNMTPAQMSEAVSLRRPGVLFEASGGVNLDTVAAIARSGVDLISVGALTHSVRSVDLSMEFGDAP